MKDKKNSVNSCCSPAPPKEPVEKSCCTDSSVESITGEESQNITAVDSHWTARDHWGRIKARSGSFRNTYMVNPGLYKIGEPDEKAEVFVTANYKFTFDILRRELKGLDGWILVLDTKGINVWCAAGKGTFSTDELVKRIKVTGLEGIVSHRRLILPQLGGVGIKAHVVKEQSGFHLHYGPVEASDIPAYLEAGRKATKEMRLVQFKWLDRLILTPIELNAVMKKFGIYALLVLVYSGIDRSGILFDKAYHEGLLFIGLGLLSVLAGAFITPVVLPFIPFRSFAIKGWIAGLAALIVFSFGTGMTAGMSPLLIIFSYIFFPLLSSYLALQFTGATTFTNMSGVVKELKYAFPLYKSGIVISLLLLIAQKALEWRIIL
ncbi:MAG: mercury methylation corrinoid protein HgcA [Deltaproteobacteria bacterium]|nr:mercury methylation corrinoid protein HgcA [Deltaproteobacteria bacterium]